VTAALPKATKVARRIGVLIIFIFLKNERKGKQRNKNKTENTKPYIRLCTKKKIKKKKLKGEFFLINVSQLTSGFIFNK
jgi:hypothetical protein